MKTDRELLEKAIEALNLINHRGNNDEELFKVGQTVTLIQERLAEDDDEPVAYMMVNNTTTGLSPSLHFKIPHWHITWEAIPLFRRPQPKARLTDEEIRLIVRGLVSDVTVAESVMFRDVARAIEQKIWEKTNG